ncbi:aldehyde dehydrogenase family protein [Pseudobacillus wudalianchiensis]|uniref:Aldehyde dehydrogenase n=1 Tax=Pseudobacillus wudalianchiensis TaxID=1743143 RepID=A0A1B9B7S3_9BACI|nr:aldehyde dehydrogenase family protein [Bacillus wudalianchiensis]OCA92138.1 aldehyde dehydrogenase [Bacillus wudalianchiensis]
MIWTVKSPATKKVIGTLDETPLERAEDLYDNANKAFLTWSGLSISERVHFLQKLRLSIVEQLDDIVKVIHDSTGKVAVEALTTEVMTVVDSISHIEKRAAAALKTRKVKTPITFIGKSSYIEYKPRGTVLVISPWNFPFQLSMIPIVEALVAGNAVILKPSEITPMVGVLIEQLFEQAGFPAGLLQVAHGGKELGAALVKGKPDFIHFTGSVRTGKIIQAEAAKQLIPTLLELGGKDPMIVCADANMERAVQGAIWGAFTNSGQVCMSVERVYVDKSIYQKFVDRLVQETQALKQGIAADSDIGSMTFPQQTAIIKAHVKDALEKGAELIAGDHPDQWKDGQMFIEPMILTKVDHGMAIMQEETFGPVLPVMPFETEEEAIALANDTRFGLNASVWTADLDRGKRIVSRLISGNAVINDVIITVANPYLPYGGAKEGGIGAYHGDVGMQNFCVQTAVMVDKGHKKKEVNWYPYEGKYEAFVKLIRSFWGEKRDWGQFLSAYKKLLKIGNKK